MASTIDTVKADVAEPPLLNKRNLILGVALYCAFYSWVRWYEGVYGWTAGLDSFAPEFETYWMNFLYIEFVLEVVIASFLWGWLWKTRDRKVMSITPREDTSPIGPGWYATALLSTGVLAISPSKMAHGIKQLFVILISRQVISSNSI